MSTLPYTHVKSTVKFAFATIAGIIRVAKHAKDLVLEIKDTQPDEVIELLATDGREGVAEILAALKE